MLDYFKLQGSITSRKIKDSGIEPVLAYLILAIGFVILSMYLFHKTSYAGYLYVFFACTIIVKYSEKKRNEFLKTIFLDRLYYHVRIIENLIISFPFVLFLCYQMLFIFAIILIIVTLLLALWQFKTSFSFPIPTPFYQNPFEFTVGFRNTFYLFLVSYGLLGIAIFVDNFNLGIVGLLLTFLITLTYYTKPEDEYFVWSFAYHSKLFLVEKIKTALVYATMLSLPLVVVLSVFFFQEIEWVLLFVLAGYIYLICIILAKYAAYPNEINVIQAILLAISIYVPPLLLLIIPYFYLQSIKQLNKLLK